MTELHLQLERAVETALATYSNVHRGSGHHARATTRLYDRAKDIVLEYLQLDRRRHLVVFCSPRRATKLTGALPAGSYRVLSSQDLGIPLGLRALAIARRALPKGRPFEAGGGTARLVSKDRVMWAHDADRFEAGTPAIVNAVAFARALQARGEPGAQPSDTVDLGDPCSDGTGRELLERLRRALIGRGARVPTATGERAYVNLDNAASTPTFWPIWNAVRRAWRLSAAEQSALVERAKTSCASALGAPRTCYDVVFTSNTTEAINIVADSFAKQARANADREPVVVGTYLEHNSNELPWWPASEHPLLRIPSDLEGGVDLDALEGELRAYNEAHAHGRRRIALIAVTGAANVLGVLPPLADICCLAHRYGAKVLVDGAQLVAHRPVHAEACGIDYLVFSGHKVYAPFGTGVLLARRGLLALSPSELESIRASGEENVGGIAAVATALDLLTRIGFDLIREEEDTLTRRALAGMALLPKVRVHGTKHPTSPRLRDKGGIIPFDVKLSTPGRIARALAERGGIGVRYGCHCAHLSVKRMLGVPPWAERLQHFMLTVARKASLPGVVRISFGLQTTPAEVDTFLETLGAIVKRGKHARLGPRMRVFEQAVSEAVYAKPGLGHRR
jgi:selenocysteine lyase/cysteine desulfurase